MPETTQHKPSLDHVSVITEDGFSSVACSTRNEFLLIYTRGCRQEGRTKKKQSKALARVHLHGQYLAFVQYEPNFLSLSVLVLFFLVLARAHPGYEHAGQVIIHTVEALALPCGNKAVPRIVIGAGRSGSAAQPVGQVSVVRPVKRVEQNWLPGWLAVISSDWVSKEGSDRTASPAR